MLRRSRFKALNIPVWVWVALVLSWSLYEHARRQKSEPEKQKGPQEAHALRGVGGAVGNNPTHSSDDCPTESPSKRGRKKEGPLVAHPCRGFAGGLSRLTLPAPHHPREATAGLPRTRGDARRDSLMTATGEPTSQQNDDFPCATCNRWSTDCCGPWETPEEHEHD